MREGGDGDGLGEGLRGMPATTWAAMSRYAAGMQIKGDSPIVLTGPHGTGDAPKIGGNIWGILGDW